MLEVLRQRLAASAAAFDGMLEELEGSEQRTRRFVADAAHELRTPITGVQAVAEALVQAPVDSPDRDQMSFLLVREARRAGRLVDDLLADPRDLAVLHGDIHHRNVLDAGDDRWVAIDPKGLYGERTFDYVNIFRNPEFEIASDPDRFLTRLHQIKVRAEIDPDRLLSWIAAFCALSIVWGYYPEGSAEHDRTIGQLALRNLADRS